MCPDLKSNTNAQKNVLAVSSIALSLSHVGQRLSQLPVRSLIGSPGTLAKGVVIRLLQPMSYKMLNNFRTILGDPYSSVEAVFPLAFPP